MNKELEQKIVEMKFDNSDFEQKVAQSLVTLGKLKESTKLEDAGKGLDNLAKSAKGLDLGSIAEGIEQLNARFSNLGVVGMTIMQRLTNAAIDMGQKIGAAITEAPRDGWKEYELNLDSVKTILNSAKTADGLPVTLDQVNQKLAELNEYSDKTIYSFSDMTNNIGKFTNAGVDLDSAVTAIQGVANVAALAGANASDASRAMYNFGQALGSGSVKLIDWKSIENANMATVDFKEQLLQTALELKTVRKEGDKYVSTTKNMQGKVSDAFTATQGFNDSLAHQWMTSEVLTKTLAKYTDETTDLGKAAIEAATQVTTFSKLIDTLKESMGSGWMQTWQYIFGDFEESKKLWTDIYRELDGIIQKVAGARNEFLKGWKEAGGRDELLGALGNIWTTVKYYVDLITKAFATAFPKIDAKPIVAVSKGLNAFTERVKPSVEAMEKLYGKVEDTAEAVTDVAERAEKFNEIVQQIINGDWGNGQERIDRLTEAGYAFENLQNAVNEVLGCEKRYETTMSDNEAVGLSANDVLSENAALLEDQAKGVAAVTDELADQNPIVGNLAKILLGISSTVKVLKSGISTVWNTLARGASVLTVVKGALGIILEVFGALGGKLYQFNSWILSFSSAEGFFKGLSGKLLSLEKRLLNAGINITNLSKVGRVLLSVFTKIKTAVDSFFTSLSNGAKALNFDRIKVGVFEFGRFVAGVLIIALNALAGVVVTVYNGLNKLKDAVMGLTVVQKLVSTLKNLKAEFKTFKDNLIVSSTYTTYLKPILEEMANTMSRLGHAVLPILSDAFNFLAKVVSVVGNKLDKFYNVLKASGALDRVSNIFTNFKAAIKDIPELITSLYNSIKSGKLPTFDNLPATFKNLVDSLKGLKGFAQVKIDETLGKVIEFFSGIFKKLPDSKKLGPFSGFVEKLKKAFDDFKIMAEGAGGSVALFTSKVIDKLSKIDFRGGAITALIGALGIFVFRWSKVGKSASKALKAMATFIKNGGQVAQTAVDKYNGFLKIAAAIGIIAGSIWLLAQVPADRFREVCIALGVAFAAMAGTILLLSALKIPEDQIKAIGIAFGGMGVGFLAVAAAAKIIGNMDENELKKGGGALVGFVVMVVAAAKLAGKVGVGAGAAFVGLGVALLLLIPSIVMFSKMDTHTLVKGGVAVFAFMLMIAKAANVAGDAKGALGAFLGISLALLLLIPSIKILSNMDAPTLLKGGAAVVALMFMMAEAAKRANGGSKGFLGMAVAIAVITGAMYVLAGLPWAALFMSSKSLSIVLNSVGDALSKVGKMKFTEILKGVAGLALAVGLISAALYLLSEKGDSTEQLKSALGIAAILVAFRLMAPAIETLSKIDFASGVQAAGNAMVFFGAMVLCLGALGEVASWGDGKFGDAIVNGANMIGRIIRALIDGIAGKGTEKDSDNIVRLGNSLSNFGGSMRGFLDGLYGVDDTTVTNAKNLATAILALCGADLLNALTGWLRGSKDLGSFSDTLQPLTQAVIDMNAALADETIDGEKIGQVSEVIKTFTDLAESLPSTGGLLQKLVGVKDLSTFAEDMSEFMSGGFSSFVFSLNGLNLPLTLLAKILIVKETTSAMIDLANDLPKSGFLSTLIDGTANLGEFAASMAEFLSYDKYGLFVTRVSMVADADLAKIRGNIIPATQEMINLANKLKENTSVIDALTGRKNLGKFGETLADFGGGISKFSDSIANVETFKIVNLTGVMYSLAALNTSDKIKGKGLSAFGTNIIDVGKAFGTFAKDTADINPEYITVLIAKLSDLHNLMVILAATDYSGVENFETALIKLASASISGFVTEFTANTEAAAEAVRGFNDAVTAALGGNEEDIQARAKNVVVTFTSFLYAPGAGILMTAAGEHLGAELIDGVNKKTDDYKSSADSIVGAYHLQIRSLGSKLVMMLAGGFIGAFVIKGISEMSEEFTKSATGIVETYSAGLISKRDLVRSSGMAMALAAYNGARAYTDDFYDLGQDAADGYARGIRSKAEDVADEARSMVEDGIKAAQRAQDSASPSKIYRGLGGDGGTGYALGFRDSVGVVVAAVEDTGYAGIKAMQNTIGRIHDLIGTDLDLNPTITPVIDLSEMSTGISMANGMLSNVNLDALAASAAFTIASQHNASLAQAQNESNFNYSKDLNSLIENTTKLIAAVKQNRYAIIDGDSAFDFIDRRMGMA